MVRQWTHVRVPVKDAFRQDLVPFPREGGLWILRSTLVVFMASEHGSPSRMCMFTRCGRLLMPHPGRQRCLRELTGQKSAFGVLHAGAGLWGGRGGHVHRAMASLISCIYWRVRRNSPSCHTSAQPPQRPTTTCVWDRTGCSPLRRGPEAGAHRNQTGGVLHDGYSCCGLVDAETGATPALVVATRGAALTTVHHHRRWRRKPRTQPCRAQTTPPLGTALFRQLDERTQECGQEHFSSDGEPEAVQLAFEFDLCFIEVFCDRGAGSVSLKCSAIVCF